jgi:hypothetical protein
VGASKATVNIFNMGSLPGYFRAWSHPSLMVGPELTL